MKKLFLASALAISLLAMLPADSHAFWNSPQSSQGLPWLQGRALNFLSRNHQHGPLYNYGPYQSGTGFGTGYEWKYVPNPLLGHYVPAYPANYYGGYAIPPGSHWNGGQLPYPATSTGPGSVVPQGVPQPTAQSELPAIVVPSAVVPTNPALGTTSPILTAPKTTTSNYYGAPAPSYFTPSRNPMPK